ncbi:uncharacterized protein LOC109610506 [Camponotus floridanus]|uniref:uncharacterized protein LOC109610506 n=1 Tax=Camponotus floridanus TaxID=104421 RepID=UPI000DC6BB30|nr:uncharacterized protein LOC109610506 [Camponotus floridanus]
MWHACALFKIASYRIENAIEKNTLMIPIFGRQYLFYQRLVHAILIHRRAVDSLSINLFQLTSINNRSFEDIFIVILLIVIHISYMFIVNYGGQKVTDHGMEVFKATYSGLWYIAPLHTQKLLLFIMQKGNINVTIIWGRLYIACLEGFASLTNAGSILFYGDAFYTIIT